MAVTYRFATPDELAASRGTIVPSGVVLPAGSYTTLRTYGGNGVVRLEQHVRRLVDSLPAGTPQTSGLDLPSVRSALAHVLREAAHPEARVRITCAPPAVFMAVEPFTPLEPSLREEGVACVTVTARRDRPEAKDTRFLATAHAAYASLPAGIHEGLLVGDDGAILEGLSSNFFAVLAGALRTEDTRALRGVTRSMVLDVAAGILPLVPGAARRDEIAAIEESFITSVSREVLPVVRIDGVVIGGGVPGPATRGIIRRFEAAVAAEVERLF